MYTIKSTLAVALIMAFALTACGKSDPVEKPVPTSGNTSVAASTAEENTSPQNTATQKYKRLDNKEAFTAAYQMTGIDIEPYAGTAGGLAKNGLAYISVSIQPGKEKETEAIFRDEFGESIDSSEDVLLPARGVNDIFDAINNADSFRLYQYTRQGDNGAKTKTTEIFFVEEDNITTIYILGAA